jgi:hypothetical protein
VCRARMSVAATGLREGFFRAVAAIRVRYFASSKTSCTL